MEESNLVKLKPAPRIAPGIFLSESRSSLGGPRAVQEPLKTRPRAIQEPPRWLQKLSRCFQQCQRASKTASRASKSLQEHPRCLQDARRPPTWPSRRPSWSQDGLQDPPRPPKTPSKKPPGSILDQFWLIFGPFLAPFAIILGHEPPRCSKWSVLILFWIRFWKKIKSKGSDLPLKSNFYF